MEPVTKILERLRTGDDSAREQLLHLVYDELHRIAAMRLRSERPGHTLQATALVNEAYLKLFEKETCDYSGRAHFLAVASRVMRQILVDYGRARAAGKRGGGNLVVGWEGDAADPKDPEAAHLRLLIIDRALHALAHEDEMLARIVEMRYFGGMTAEETAEALGQSVHLVRHNIRLAQAWLRRELDEGS